MNTLIFIDTNIILEFYRVRHQGAKLQLLKVIEDNVKNIITGDQIEMEYKKNRQKVILQSLKDLKTPQWNTITTPAFLETNLTAQSIGKSQKEIEDKIKTIRRRIGNVLTKPNRHDPIYKSVQKLFNANGVYNLSRDKKIRFKIRNLAKKRWILGYPPRKDQDNSIGDAINWEWIIECAIASRNNVVIVSRDSDYGNIYENKPILNDWLSREFNQRVSKKRKLYLTDRLSHGFELANIKISEKAKKDEQDAIVETRASKTAENDLIAIAKGWDMLDVYREYHPSTIQDLLTLMLRKKYFGDSKSD